MSILDDGDERFKKIDSKDMLGLIMNFPSQCEAAISIARETKVPNFKKPNNIVFTGLGGSAIGADLVRSYLSGGKGMPIFVNRDYSLPDFVGRDTLVFACSYSGNTEETLSAYKEAGRRKSRRIAISSGGRLARLADEDHVPLVKMPANASMPPRAALGYSFFIPLLLLAKMHLIPSPQAAALQTIRGLKKLRDERIGPEIKTPNNPAKQLAERIYGEAVRWSTARGSGSTGQRPVLAKGRYGNFPIIYGAAHHIDAVVTRWRTQFAENAKWLSSSHLFPEMNHNEIVGWENPHEIVKGFLVIVLRDKADHPRVKRRMDVTRSIINKVAKDVIEVSSTGSSLLSRIFSLIYIGDMVSFYLAILNGVDPTPIKRIDYLKAKLKEKRG